MKTLRYKNYTVSQYESGIIEAGKNVVYLPGLQNSYSKSWLWSWASILKTSTEILESQKSWVHLSYELLKERDSWPARSYCLRMNSTFR